MKKKKCVLFPFIRYYTPERLAKYLREMSAQGWFPSGINLFSYFVMTFVKAEKHPHEFAVDFNFMSDKNYKAFFYDFGWIHLGNMSNLNIWYYPKNDNACHEIYTDYEHKIRNIKRYSCFMWAIIIPFFMFFAIISLYLIWSFKKLFIIKKILYIALDLIFFTIIFVVHRQYRKLQIDNNYKKESIK